MSSYHGLAFDHLRIRAKSRRTGDPKLDLTQIYFFVEANMKKEGKMSKEYTYSKMCIAQSKMDYDKVMINVAA